MPLPEVVWAWGFLRALKAPRALGGSGGGVLFQYILDEPRVVHPALLWAPTGAFQESFSEIHLTAVRG